MKSSLNILSPSSTIVDTWIAKTYNSILKNRDNYGVFHKCLFHIHTPASYDYCFYEEYRNNPNKYKTLTLDEIFAIAKREKLFPVDVFKSHDDLKLDKAFSDKKEYISYLLIAQKLFENEIELAIIADHNTLAGFHKLKSAISIYGKDRCFSIYPQLLLGVEISCADKNHIVGIFNPAEKEDIGKLSHWLEDNIMSPVDGTYYTSIDVLSLISQLHGIGYIAHIDTSDTFSNKYLNKAYKSKLFACRPSAIGLSDFSRRTDISRRIAEVNQEEFAYFWDCDSHSIDTLNQKAFWIKGQKCNFNMIKNAIRDFEIAIQFDRPKEPNQFILGIAIASDEKSFLTSSDKTQAFQVSFSDSLNCFIGGRGTGKSTVLNIINFVLGQHLPQDKVEAKRLLDFICLHPRIIVFYRYNDEDYVVSFSSPSKEYADDDILKSFTTPTPFNQRYNYNYSYTSNEVAEYTLKNYIDLYKVNTLPSGTTIEKATNKRRLLIQFYNVGYSVNDLVHIAGSKNIGKYVFSTLFRNRTLSQKPTRHIKSRNGLQTWTNEMESYLLNRAVEVHQVIDSYNSTQDGKLKIVYTQENSGTVKFSFEELFASAGNQLYKNYNISVEYLCEYMYALVERIGLVQLINLLLKKQYDILNKNISLLSFCMEMSTTLIEKGAVELNSENLFEFYQKLDNDIFNDSKIKYWVDIVNGWISEVESFDIHFNVNNKEQSKNEQVLYKPIGQLSLGQKVVTMLSFVLTYSEYSKDFSPLIIDQPEDNLDNQYIYKNLVKDLRDIKSKRQVIIATHSSTIVTNAKAEQVVVMLSDNEHGWVERRGYPTEPTIIKNIINLLEGGTQSFKHKAFMYEDIVTK